MCCARIKKKKEKKSQEGNGNVPLSSIKGFEEAVPSRRREQPCLIFAERLTERGGNERRKRRKQIFKERCQLFMLTSSSATAAAAAPEIYKKTATLGRLVPGHGGGDGAFGPVIPAGRAAVQLPCLFMLRRRSLCCRSSPYRLQM